MKPKNIKTEMWRLILLPTLLIILLLACSLTCLYVTQLNGFVETRGSTLTQNVARLSQYALLKNDEVLLESILDAAREESLIRAIDLYDHRTGQHLHLGPAFPPAVSGPTPELGTSGMRFTSGSILFSHPIVDVDNNQPMGWVELELLTSPFLVLRYEALIITIILTVIGLLITVWRAIYLHGKIAAPLDHIKCVIRKLAKGKLYSRVEPQQCQEFSELAESVNAMALSMEKARQDMQAYIDQSTSDLRETLETIEIQNIDLDIARKEALHASRIKSEFLANTSHEIRTPLNGILGFTNLALRTDLDEQQREYLHTIRDSSQHLLTVINSILDFSKIEAGKLTLDYAPLSLRRAVDETLHILAFDAHEKNLQLISWFDPAIPENLLGDSLRFKQVLSNLISNAIKFSHRGDIVIDIVMLNQQATQTTIKVTVSDEGIGLSEEQKQKLFNAFAQADTSSTREYGGTGLGLAISRGLVERMGGTIGVDSEIERGAKFWFTARFGIDKKQPSPHQKTYLNGNRILLCGENIAAVTQVQQLLQLWQTECQQINAIHDIFPALRNARDTGQPFAVTILDIAPSERKIQPALLHNLTRQLQEEFGCKVIVCCTAAHQRVFCDHNDKLAAVFVNKPTTHDALLQALGRQLNVAVKDTRQQDVESEEQKNGKKNSVLVVDDNPANLQLAGELLRGLNAHVAQANSGKQALDLCAENTFDIIFMDIQMPGMDGIETTRRLRMNEKNGRRTPIIALTAHSMTEQKHELLIAGMDDCVSKPVSEAQLAHIINRWAGLTGKKEVTVISVQDRQNATTQRRLKAISDVVEDATSVDILLSLRLANNKPALARDMLAMLLQDLEDERQQINRAFAVKNFIEMETLIHRLYGSCCYCGVPVLKKISGIIDKHLQAGKYDELIETMESFNRAVDDILQWSENKNIDVVFSVEEPGVPS